MTKAEMLSLSARKLMQIQIQTFWRLTGLLRLNGLHSYQKWTTLLTWRHRFKLHLRPSHLAAEQGLNVNDIPALPPNKTVIDIFSYILRYLYGSTKQYIRGRQGDDMWESFGTNIDFVLGHPNGWEARQQSLMRRAAIAAGLVANTAEGSERISFVTEGEASLHYCLNNIPDALRKYVSQPYYSIRLDENLSGPRWYTNCGLWRRNRGHQHICSVFRGHFQRDGAG
jgi:hypothetical protein